MQATGDLLANGFIYTYIDFNNTPWFDYLSIQDKVVLTNYLTDIIKSIGINNPGLQYPPRLRFASFTNVHNFTLVSDSNVISPYKDDGITSPIILDGLSYRVDGGFISGYYGSTPIAVNNTEAQAETENNNSNPTVVSNTIFEGGIVCD
jgi:hypothetical protein